MAKMTTVRRCPYCAEEIRLGDCPIVATSFTGAEYLSSQPIRATQIELPSQTKVKETLKKTGWPIVAEPAGVAAGKKKRKGWGGLGTIGGSATLPSLFDETAREDLPARACPACELPLPQSIDERPALVIGVIGVNRVGKTHLLASCLTQASRQRGLSRIGCRDFALDESTAKRFREEYYEPLFRQGEVLDVSQASDVAEIRFRPLIFNATLPNLGPVSLILHDVAGEVMADPRTRAAAAPYLRGARGIIFVIDPREIDALRAGLPDWLLHSNAVGFDQGALLSACLRPDGIVDRGEVIPVAIALGKADLLPEATGRQFPFLDRRSRDPERLQAFHYARLHSRRRERCDGARAGRPGSRFPAKADRRIARAVRPERAQMVEAPGQECGTVGDEPSSAPRAAARAGSASRSESLSTRCSAFGAVIVSPGGRALSALQCRRLPAEVQACAILPTGSAATSRA